ncbi:hypothetical protein O9992_00170 [Vibrio lentus]|nr:hypothetical protein [Vibrio lentus]
MKGLYTDAIYELPFSVVFTRGDVQTLSNYAELEGEKVAILSGWSITPQLSRLPKYRACWNDAGVGIGMLLKMVNICGARC